MHIKTLLHTHGSDRSGHWSMHFLEQMTQLVKIILLFQDQNDYYSDHKGPPFKPILRHFIPVHFMCKLSFLNVISHPFLGVPGGLFMRSPNCNEIKSK